MRYLIKFSYDGTKFHGFQRQNDVKNVQGTLEHVLSDVLESDIVIKGAGRTDAGVHAITQCAHFDVDRKIKKEDINIINRLLNGEIKIKKWQVVNSNFHARHDVKRKKYVYKLNIGEFDKDKEGYYYQIKYKLDFSLMKRVMKLYVGTHDFRNFVSGPKIDYTTTIYKTRIKRNGNETQYPFKCKRTIPHPIYDACGRETRVGFRTPLHRRARVISRDLGKHFARNGDKKRRFLQSLVYVDRKHVLVYVDRIHHRFFAIVAFCEILRLFYR